MSSHPIASKLVKHIINSAIVHTIWSIWIERNNRCFSNKQSNMSTIFNSILAEVKLSFKLVIGKGASAGSSYGSLPPVELLELCLETPLLLS